MTLISSEINFFSKLKIYLSLENIKSYYFKVYLTILAYS